MASRMSRQAHRAFHDFPISVSLAITLRVGLAIREGLLRPSPCLVIAVPIGIPRTPNIEPPRLSRRRGPTPGLPEGDIWILLP